MAIKPELFHAILSMDAYSRGYGGAFDALSGPVDGQPDVGNAIVVETSSFVPLRDKDGELFVDQTIGFYALGYDTNADGFADVISYRGTDDFSLLPPSPDIVHGWSLAVPGLRLQSEQGQMAVAFYNFIEQQSDRPSEQITLTGHSLGGGLAGFISSMLGVPAYVYDSMEYRAAAQDAINDPTFEYHDFVDADLDFTFDFGKVTGYFVEGEALSNSSADPFMPQAEAIDYINADARIADLNGIDLNPIDLEGLGETAAAVAVVQDAFTEALYRHSQAALVISLFGREPEANYGASLDIAKYFFWPLLFDADFALSVGMNAASLGGALQTDGKYADILQRIIAYSALNDGERPFGDTAIRALYNDANDLGSVLALGSYATEHFLSLAPDFAKVFVNHAAQLALNDVEASAVPTATNGVLGYRSDSRGTTFAIDLSFDSSSVPYGANASSLNALRDKIVYDAALYASGAEDGETVTFGDWEFDPTGNAAIGQVVYKIYGGLGHTLAAPIGDGVTMYIGANGGDRSWGSTGDDLFIGGNGDDTYTTLGGNDTLIGGSGGNDILSGGLDNDTYVFGEDWGIDRVNEEGGYDTIQFTHHRFDDIRLQRDIGVNGAILNIYQRDGKTDVEGQYIYSANHFTWEPGQIERLIDADGVVIDMLGGLTFRGTDGYNSMAGTNEADTFETFKGNDTIRGYGGNDTLDGGPGTDMLEGGYGSDTYIFRPGHGTDTISEMGRAPFEADLGETDTIYLDGILPTQIQIVEDTQGRLTIYTSADLANWIYVPGYSSNYNPNNEPLIERIAFSNGATLNLTVRGDATNLFPGAIGETVSAIGGESFAFAISDLLANDFDPDETAPLTITSVDNVVGGVAEINGDVIDFAPVPGFGGTAGFDYFVSDGIATVPVSLLISYPGTDGDDAFRGDAQGNTFSGFAGEDIFYGGDGNDKLDGGIGDDEMFGGAGDDRIDAGDGTDYVQGGGGSDIIRGDAGADELMGGFGADEIFGGTGRDSLFGGDNRDTLFGGSKDDFIDAGRGHDTIDGGEDRDRLFGGGGKDNAKGGSGSDFIKGGRGDDRLSGDGAADDVFGGSGSDEIYGGGGHDSLFGGDQSDVIYGESGDDFVDGGIGGDNIDGADGRDRLKGGKGTDEIYGGAQNDIILGGSGKDSLFGGAGQDTLYGGTGQDVLMGGGGADTFAFTTLGHSGRTAQTRDIILDFASSQGDLIDLSGIDAVIGAGNQAFEFIGDAAFSGVAGELRVKDTGANVLVQADVTGDGGAEFALLLRDVAQLGVDDFIL